MVLYILAPSSGVPGDHEMTTTVEKPMPGTTRTAPERSPDPEALIKEARRRQRRRRLMSVAFVAVAAAVGGSLYLIVARSGSSAGHRSGNSASSVGTGTALVSPKRPAALAVAANGDLLLIDAGRDQILERVPSGRFKVFAGTGKLGFSGDGGPAIDAALSQPSAIAVAHDGSVYVADTGNNRIRKISRDGTITTVAGDGKGGWTRSGLRATHAPVASPSALAYGPDGRLYIVAGGWGEVLRLDRNGTLTRIAGIHGRYAGVYGLGHPATEASIDGANGLAFDAAGNLYLAGFNTKTLLMIDRHGIMRAPLGTKIGFYARGSGGLTTTPDGHVLAIETQDIVELSPQGEKTIYRFGHKGIAGITGFLPAGIATANGRVYTDTGFGNGWSSGSAILALDVAHHQAKVLWSHRGA
jgi:DNA-binding beta-propeller fold protein YncE